MIKLKVEKMEQWSFRYIFSDDRMKFYTNVQMIGNQILVRGVDNGQRYEARDEFYPTLFVKSKRGNKI